MEKFLKNISTKELCDELNRREGVQQIVVEPYEAIDVAVGNKAQKLAVESGPCKVFVVYD